MMSNHRVITTLAELRALGIGAVILDDAGDAMQREDDGWYCGDVQDIVNLPARVLLEAWDR